MTIPLKHQHSNGNGSRSVARPRPKKSSRRIVRLKPWLDIQMINAGRHVEALRPFQRSEFGTSAAMPTEAHVKAANDLVATLRADLEKITAQLGQSVENAAQERTSAQFARILAQKELAHNHVQRIERVWDFYFELFGQRQSQYGDWLLSCDRIALDCYQYIYLGLGTNKTIPSPPPFAYMRTGFSPATYRRSIPLQRLGKQLNPFPLIQLPYHRLINPWALGAILHEVSHNTQNDLGLEQIVPRVIASTLLEAGCSRFVAQTWTRWNREMFADMSGLLLGGPAVVASLMDVIGRSRSSTLKFVPRAPHPTPYLRAFLSIELLRRMGFVQEAESYRRMWVRLYPDPRFGSIPAAMLANFEEVIAMIVDAVCYQRFKTLGGKSLAEVIRFERKEQMMIEEAAQRLATGIDPGVVPERFLIGAARVALEKNLASPEDITRNFYRELTRR
jgi:hypothetical protein